jgi:hypothetical protein
MNSPIQSTNSTISYPEAADTTLDGIKTANPKFLPSGLSYLSGLGELPGVQSSINQPQSVHQQRLSELKNLPVVPNSISTAKPPEISQQTIAASIDTQPKTTTPILEDLEQPTDAEIVVNAGSERSTLQNTTTELIENFAQYQAEQVQSKQSLIQPGVEVANDIVPFARKNSFLKLAQRAVAIISGPQFPDIKNPNDAESQLQAIRNEARDN